MDKDRLKRERFNAKKIPLVGSLGILALGDIGFEAWRNVKISHNLKEQDEKK